MNTNDIISKATIDATPRRVLEFLLGHASDADIRRILLRVGLTMKETERAWSLLRQASAFQPAAPPADDRAIEAIKELDAWDEPNLKRIDMALAHYHPEQRAFVMTGVEPTTGAAVVLSVETLLDRMDALESAPEREATRDADHAALATLVERGYTPEERQRLRLLVTTAKQFGEVGPDPDLVTEDQIEEAQRALRAWWVDWSTTARTVLTGRQQLIRLGLARRRAPEAPEEEDEGGAEPAKEPTVSGSPLNGAAPTPLPIEQPPPPE